MLDILLDRITIEEMSLTDNAPSPGVVAKLQGSLASVTRSSRRARVFGALAVVFFGLALAAVILAGLAIQARNDAIAQTKTANSRRLAALSESERDIHLDRSLLLAVESVNASRPKPTSEAREALLSALTGRPEVSYFLHIERGNHPILAFRPGGKVLAAGYH